MNLPVLPEDKANHALYGAVIALIAYGIVHKTYPQAAIWASLLAASTAGVLKEVSDWWQNRKGGHHGIEFWDAAATIAGGLIVVATAAVGKI